MFSKLFSLKIVLAFAAILIAGVGIVFFLTPRSTTPTQNTIAMGQEEKPKFVTLEVFDGGVSVKNIGEDYKKAINGQEIFQGSTVKTDSTGRAQILYTNGTSTRIDVNSEVSLSEFSQSPFTAKLTLNLGTIWSRVAKLLGGETYETQSANVVATVRGTSYEHSIMADGENKITVTKGTVVGDCKNKKQAAAAVEEDQKGLFNCKDKIPKIAALDKSDTDSFFKFNEDQDLKIEKRFGRDTFKDIKDVKSDSTLGQKEKSILRFDEKLKLYYFAPEAKSLIEFLSPTPTPTIKPLLDSSKLKDVLGTDVLKLFTPTPTPTPRLDLKTDSTSKQIINILQTATPTPTLNPALRQEIINGGLIIQPTPTPSPLPTANPLYQLRDTTNLRLGQ